MVLAKGRRSPCKQRYNKDVKIGLIGQSLGVRVFLKLIQDRVDRSLRLCKVKRSLPCCNDQQTDLTSFVHALVYNSSFYKGNSHQSIQFYP